MSTASAKVGPARADLPVAPGLGWLGTAAADAADRKMTDLWGKLRPSTPFRRRTAVVGAAACRACVLGFPRVTHAKTSDVRMPDPVRWRAGAPPGPDRRSVGYAQPFLV